jgi:hypothetical protein
MTSIILTRFLYIYDDVVASFICSMLKNEYYKSLYWIYEIYYSGFVNETFDLLWKTYYNFYAIYNPKLESYIKKKHNSWKSTSTSNKDNIPAFIVKNLIISKHNHIVFLLNQYMNTQPITFKIFRGRRPNWLLEYPQKYRNLLLSISKNTWPTICYHLNSLELNNSTEINEIYNILIKYFTNIQNITIRNTAEDQLYDITVIPYKNYTHILLALILHMTICDENINKRKLFITPSQDDLDVIYDIEQTEISPIYKTLEQKRYYEIDNDIGVFELSRFNHTHEDIVYAIRHQWEYYAAKSHIWKTRMAEYGINFNDKCDIIFPNDDKLEEFYEKYGYEPDEQSTVVQDLSTKNISQQYWKEWINKIFDEITDVNKCLIDIKNDDFYFSC